MHRKLVREWGPTSLVHLSQSRGWGVASEGWWAVLGVMGESDAKGKCPQLRLKWLFSW